MVIKAISIDPFSAIFNRLTEESVYKRNLIEGAARVKADIQYYRDLEARDNAQQYDLAKKKISAWRDVGVAYGNHQKANVYYTAWPVRY